jgi:hypothetical protein
VLKSSSATARVLHDDAAERAAREHGRFEQITALGVNRISDKSWKAFIGGADPSAPQPPKPPRQRPPSRVEFLQDF